MSSSSSAFLPCTLPITAPTHISPSHVELHSDVLSCIFQFLPELREVVNFNAVSKLWLAAMKRMKAMRLRVSLYEEDAYKLPLTCEWSLSKHISQIGAMRVFNGFASSQLQLLASSLPHLAELRCGLNLV